MSHRIVKICLGLATLIFLIGLLFLACTAPACEEEIGKVEVLGVWGGDELASFEAMVAPWEKETGGDMQFTGTRDYANNYLSGSLQPVASLLMDTIDYFPTHTPRITRCGWGTSSQKTISRPGMCWCM